MPSYPLVPWPDPALPAVRAVTAQVAKTSEQLLVRFVLESEVAALRLPEPAARPGPHDGLWQHTCFEAFVGDGASARYAEFNFSPSGSWAGYAFSRPRVRVATALAAITQTPRCRHDGGTLHLDARIDVTAIGWTITPATPIGLSAVLEARDGRLTYWALCHPGAKPDFHDRRGWIARAVAQETTE